MQVFFFSLTVPHVLSAQMCFFNFIYSSIFIFVDWFIIYFGQGAKKKKRQKFWVRYKKICLVTENKIFFPSK